MDEGDVLDLTVEAVDEFEFGFGATICLAFSIDFMGDFLFENFGGLGILQDLVLAE